MITFLIGISILIIGYIFYSKFIEKQFCITDEKTPCYTKNDGVDFIPLDDKKNLLIHLLNIAGLGPILGAIQGILFGPVAFLIIPLGCIFMGGVHDFCAGILSVKNDGIQMTEIIRKYFGNNVYRLCIILTGFMLLMVASVFVYTSGDLIAERFFHQNDFSITNPVMITIYSIIAIYYIIAALFPIDKIIGRFYPFLGLLLLFGTALILFGFITRGVHLNEINFLHLNEHPKGFHIIPMFFMTVSCGLLSGFHSTQATIVSRTVKSQKSARKLFYGMMTVESLIAMIWAAGAYHVYSLNLVSSAAQGTVTVINTIADVFVAPLLVFVVTLAIVTLPITSGDTALRGLRMILSEHFHLEQSKIINRLKIIIPLSAIMFGIVIFAKGDKESFNLIWRYFNFGNQLISIPMFLAGSVYLINKGKNPLVTFIPAMFYVLVTGSFILNSKIGFNLDYNVSMGIGSVITLISGYLFYKKVKTK